MTELPPYLEEPDSQLGLPQSRLVAQVRAGFGRRLLAAIVDGVIVTLVFTIFVDGLKSAGVYVAVLFSASYFVRLEGRSGQTVGKRVFGIRVVDIQTGGRIGLGRALIRYIGKAISAAVIYVGYLWMLWDPQKQCWHDKLASDIVVLAKPARRAN